MIYVRNKVVRVTVTAEDAARGELTLPEIAATVVPAPGVGDAPTLSFKRTNGAPVRSPTSAAGGR